MKGILQNLGHFSEDLNVLSCYFFAPEFIPLLILKVLKHRCLSKVQRLWLAEGLPETVRLQTFRNFGVKSLSWCVSC